MSLPPVRLISTSSQLSPSLPPVNSLPGFSYLQLPGQVISLEHTVSLAFSLSLLPNPSRLFNLTLLLHSFPPFILSPDTRHPPQFTSSQLYSLWHQSLLFLTSFHPVLIYFQVRSCSSALPLPLIPPSLPSLLSCIPSIPGLPLAA